MNVNPRLFWHRRGPQDRRVRSPYLKPSVVLRVRHAQLASRRNDTPPLFISRCEERNWIADARFRIVKVASARQAKMLAMRSRRELACVDVRLAASRTLQILHLLPE